MHAVVGALGVATGNPIPVLFAGVVAQSLLAFLEPYLPLLQQVVLVLAVLGSVVVVRRLAGRRLLATPRERLLHGVPWGAVVLSALVTGVYVFVQDAGLGFGQPTVIPFRAWSYFYPTGIVLSGFTHAGLSHLLNNLIGTLTLGAVAEYAWGHYPRRRGAQTFTSWATNPFARIAAFVVGTVAVGVLTGFFVLGPAIGFSGVVFAFAGFALMRYPLATVVALTAGDVLSVVWSALRSPTITQAGRETFSTPWWAGIAIQGHVLGVLIGALIGAYLVRSRGTRPSPSRLWLGVLLFAFNQSMWAVFLPKGSGRYTLYRAVGAGAMFLFAALLAGALFASDRSLIDTVGRFEVDLQYREVAAILLAALVLSVAFTAVPYNVFTIDDPGAGVTEENSVQVRDYTVFYTENVPDQYVSSIDIFGSEATQVNASGVIVVSEERHIWWEVAPASRVAFDDRQGGRTAVSVGGIGWSETVYANRTTWVVLGNRSVYTVHVEHEATRRLAYSSEPSRADLLLGNRNVTVVPGEEFEFVVSRNETTLGRTAVPGVNASTTAGGLTFVREESRVYAVANETRVPVAAKAGG